ncbi:MAG: HD domain-containing phosphohydrolase, partial [Synechococcus sp.]|nr:HD domain-containing phosphohydrolase [Synechococcus sp.]
EEFDLMKNHTVLGAGIITSAEEMLAAPSTFLHFAREIALHHHENWDGSGYPHGLCGEAIPLAARLMAVADVYDALISRRCYKPPFSHAEACDFIRSQEGKKFDPVVVQAFLRIEDHFAAIAAAHADPAADSTKNGETRPQG